MQLETLNRSASNNFYGWRHALIASRRDFPCKGCGETIPKGSKPMTRSVLLRGHRFPKSEHLCVRCEGQAL